ncbi:hypothetical protein HanRHA438_Chr06g0264731 [Helianthus annuus]|uniref:Uncharacterized protein n=1 Tax=Helianthus annuus TaxID=4232 RepID=A0A9K3ISI0_HELAN|nr:hypothetical protein HanXRQr2_Chr06g0255431 [Helianthus annuus]KAJ0911583.1 hypothetical protein HanRHA438_Chr06g0264731 [Helianthus annuus]KAJ0915147.1 hypothetical protein HanPSC8_Chr06g0246611 [Helianthus annuus]
MENVRRTLLESITHHEKSNSFRHRNQIQLPLENNSETGSTTATKRPKQIFTHRFPIKNVSINIHETNIQNIIGTKPVFPQQVSIPTTAQEPANTDSSPNTSWKIQGVG